MPALEVLAAVGQETARRGEEAGVVAAQRRSRPRAARDETGDVAGVLDVEIIGVPTVREADGLAMSSRNARLSDAARTGALAISAAIRHAQEAFAEGFTEIDDLERRLHAALRRESALTVEYAVVVDAETLRPITRVARPARALVAVHVGGVRLIDNGAIG